jgi:hypothetical protein
MFKIRMVQTLQVVIANEVKQSLGIAASLPAYRQAGAPSNDHILLFRLPARSPALRGEGRDFDIRI